MRLPKAMPRPVRSQTVVLALGLLLASACAHKTTDAAASSSAYAGALAEDEDLGNPLDDVTPPAGPSIDDVLAEEDTQKLTFDDLEENDAPTSMVQSAPKRPSMPSMLPSVITGPSGAAPGQ